jgi:hypothetical protein
MARNGINDNGSIDYLKIPSNPKELIEPRLNRLLDNHAVALEIMAKHPHVLREFVCAVKEGVRNPPEPEVQKKLLQNDIKAPTY